jgi:hypothetical protein
VHCHAESALALARKELEYPTALDKNYPGAMGVLESMTQHLLDPSVSWALCGKHRKAQRAARLAARKARPTAAALDGFSVPAASPNGGLPSTMARVIR